MLNFTNSIIDGSSVTNHTILIYAFEDSCILG